MTNAENPSYNPAPEAVFDALDNNPLMPLTLGILSAAKQPLTPSEIQQFIIEAAGQTDTDEDDGSDPTHDTSEILTTCKTLEQEGLVTVSQEQADTEPYIELTAIGEQQGVHAAGILMERYIAQGHGDCRVPHNPNKQKLGIAGMIALGAVGLTAQVAKAITETLQIDEHTYKLVKDAIRNRPLRLRKPPPSAPPKAGPSSSTSKPFSKTGSDYPPLPKFSAPQSQTRPDSTPTQAKKFTSRIVDRPFILARHGLSLQSGLLPTETPMSSLSDRPKTPISDKTSTPPAAPEDQTAPASHKPDSSKSATATSDTRGRVSDTSPPPQTDPTNSQNSSKEKPYNSSKAPATTPGKQQERSQPGKDGSQRPAGYKSSGDRRSAASGEDSGEKSSLEEVKAGLAAVIGMTEIIMANLDSAGSQAEAAATFLAKAQRLASDALIPGAINPLELTPRCLSALREIAGTALDLCVADFTHVTTEATRYAAGDNSNDSLLVTIQNISQNL